MKFYLSIPALDSIVTEYRNDAEMLQNKISEVTAVMGTIGKSAWSGDDADKAREEISAYQAGKMTIMQKQARGISAIMSTLLTDCRTYKNYCNHFTDILESDSFPCVQENESVGGHILCDGDEISAAKDAARRAADAAAEIMGHIEEAENELSGLEFSEARFDYLQYTQPVRRQADDVNLRMTDYAVALQNYFDGCETADINAKGMLDGECPEEFSSGADKGTVLAIRKEASGSGLSAQEILEAEKLAGKGRNGRYGFEDVLQTYGDGQEISEVDKNALALLYGLSGEKAGSAYSLKEAGKADEIFRAFCINLYGYENGDAKPKNVYGKAIPGIATVNTRLTSMLEGRLIQQGYGSGSMAYRTLECIKGTDYKLPCYGSRAAGEYNVSIDYSDKGLITIHILGRADGCGYGCQAPDYSIGVTGYGRMKKYVLGGYACTGTAEKAGLTESQIIGILMCAGSSKDLKALSSLMKGDNDGAFSLDADEHTPGGLRAMGTYIRSIRACGGSVSGTEKKIGSMSAFKATAYVNGMHLSAQDLGKDGKVTQIETWLNPGHKLTDSEIISARKMIDSYYASNPKMKKMHDGSAGYEGIAGRSMTAGQRDEYLRMTELEQKISTVKSFGMGVEEGLTWGILNPLVDWATMKLTPYSEYDPYTSLGNQLANSSRQHPAATGIGEWTPAAAEAITGIYKGAVKAGEKIASRNAVKAGEKEAALTAGKTMAEGTDAGKPISRIEKLKVSESGKPNSQSVEHLKEFNRKPDEPIVKPEKSSTAYQSGSGSFKFSEMTEQEIARIAEEYKMKAPIEIPESAKYKAQSKAAGYEQIAYKWNDGSYKYEARWHTRTPGAPVDQVNTWVIQRIIPGSGGTKPTTYILSGDRWVPRYEWQAAIDARQAGIATQEQIEILDKGHWKEQINDR